MPKAEQITRLVGEHQGVIRGEGVTSRGINGIEEHVHVSLGGLM
jgi:hypothetical protein